MGVVTRLGVALCIVIVNKYIRNSLIFEVDLVQRICRHVVPKKTPSLRVVDVKKQIKPR